MQSKVYRIVFSYLSLFSLFVNASLPFYPLFSINQVKAEDTVSVEELNSPTTDTTTTSNEESLQTSNEVIPTPEVTTEVTPSIEITPTIEPETELTPTPSPIIAPENSTSSGETNTNEKECLTDLSKVTNSASTEWMKTENENTYKTKESVKLGIRYVFPLNDNVTITFKCLPKEESLRSSLKVEQIKSQDLKLPEGFFVAFDYAFDITTEMTNGTFEYEVNLPKYEGVKTTVSYIEKSAQEVTKDEVDENEIKTIDESNFEQKTEGNDIKINSLDHFTVFVPLAIVPVSTSSITINGSCMEDLYGKDLQCTANDVSIADVSNIQFVNNDKCDHPGDTVTFTADWTVQSNATKRYNVGLYFPTQGQTSALNGMCSISTLPNSPVPPFYDYDGNICGDISSSASVTTNIQMTITCLDPDGNNVLNLPYCTSWEQNSSTCNGPLDTVPGAPSKCNCNNGFEVPITVPFKANIEVIKDLNPSTDSGKFNLQIDGVTQTSASCIGDLGTTGKVQVGAGTSVNPGAFHTVGETACSNTSLLDYTSSISCVKRGTTTVVASSNDTGPLNFKVNKDDDIVCTIKNDVQTGSITIIKNTDSNDDKFDFTSNTLGNFSITTLNKTGSTKIDNLFPGNYDITETTSTIWGVDSLYCKDSSGNNRGTVLGNSITGINLNYNEDLTCTFNNKLLNGDLIVYKKVINDNGGTLVPGDFNLHVKLNSIDVSGSPQKGESSGTTYSLPQGSYIVSEDSLPSGYSFTGFSGDCNENGEIAVVAGKTVSCTLTNEDIQPKLTVIKEVKNNFGGIAQVSDFILKVDSTTVLSGQTNGFNAKTYTISETGPTGYSASFSSECLGGEVTLNIGDNKTCTITNTEIAPTLTLIKTVENKYGGTAQVSDFPLFVKDIVGIPQPVTSGVSTTLNSNTVYSVYEINKAGYSASNWGGDCTTDGTIILKSGENATCTITNSDIAPTLTVIKKVTNDNGGTLQENDFNLYINGNLVTNNVANKLTAGTFTVSEDIVSGYIGHFGNECLEGKVTLDIGDNKTCTIYNEDQPATLTVYKIVKNTNGGNLLPSDFTMNVLGTNVSNPTFAGSENGTTVNLDAGNFEVTENSVDGYQGSIPTNCKGVAEIGKAYSCTITNEDVAPTLTVIKKVINDNGGNLTEYDFPLFINGNPVTSGVPVTLSSNTSYTLTETNQYGYKSLGWSGDCNMDGNITLNPGQKATCTITNDDIQPSLIVNKEVRGSNEDPDSFNLYVNSTKVGNGEVKLLNAGKYIVSEDLYTNYNVSFSGDCNSVTGEVTLSVGDNKTCTIINTRKQGNITLLKEVINFGGSNALPSDWKFTINGNDYKSGDTITLDTGSYLVQEFGPDGYSLTQVGENGVCVINPTSSNTGTLTVNENGGVCKFTNTRDTGKLTILKDVDWEEDGSLTGQNDKTNVTDWKWNILDVESNIPTGDSRTLPTGNYNIQEELSLFLNYHLVGWECTNKTQGSDNLISVEITKDSDITCKFVNSPDKGSISGQKFEDSDANGNKDSNETGIQYWEIKLYDENNNVVKTIQTDSSGNYKFEDLTPGFYKVCESANSNWTRTLPQTSDCSSLFELTPGEIVSSIDFGNFKNVNITVCKMSDLDGDSKTTSDQSFVSSWSVSLVKDNNENTKDTKLTQENGCYTWENLSPNHTYKVEEENRSGWNAINDSTYDFGYPTSGKDQSYTFLNTQLGSITISKTTSPKGTSDLFYFSDALSSKQVLSDGSSFSNNDLMPGLYDVSEMDPNPLYDLTDIICNESIDNTGSIKDLANRKITINLSANETVNCEFVNSRRGLISGLKYDDVNGNGQKDSTQNGPEPVLPSWTINLYDSNNVLLKTTTTDANGEYSFNYLLNGTYKVCEENQNEWVQTSTPNCYDIVVNGDDHTNKDFGNYKLSKIWGYKFEDKNANGVWDEGELGLSNWTIYLDLNVNGVFDNEEPFALTDTNGMYEFNNLEKGLYHGGYSIKEVLQSGWEITYPENNSAWKTSYSGSIERQDFGNHRIPVTIVTSKIVCDSESDLPNWGNGGNDITATTAQDFVSTHEGCRLTSNFEFEYGPAGSGNPGDTFVGKAGGSYSLVGTTDSTGSVSVKIEDLTNYNGVIELREVLQPDYLTFSYGQNGNTNSNNVSAEFYCHTDVLNYDNWDWINSPEYGQTYYCVAFNVKTTDIHGYKWNDLNNDGIENFEEPKLSGWTIYIDSNLNGVRDQNEKYMQTSSEENHFGWYWFEDLIPGTYRVCEEQKTGWVQTYPVDPSCHDITVPYTTDLREQSVLNAVMAPTYNFGNYYSSPTLTISKINNVSNGGIVSSRGDFVTFKIIVKALENSVENVFVYDLLANGFDFDESSFVVSSNKDLIKNTANGALYTPNYASPGLWNLGNMQKDEEITIEYKAKIATNQEEGLYKDLAYALGEDLESTTPLNLIASSILNAENYGVITDKFVGTAVKIEVPVTPVKAEADTDITEIEEGEVLGASTLPSTGIELYLLIFVVLTFVAGVGLVGYSMKSKKTSKLLMLILSLGLFFSLSQKIMAETETGFVSIRVEEPDQSINTGFNLGFTTLYIDRDGNSENNDITVKCFAKKESDASYPATPFKLLTINNDKDGNNGVCEVTTSNVLTTDATYKFLVTAETVDAFNSGEVSTKYDGTNPKNPKDFEVERKNSCKYDISFKTANDGQTSKVEIYRDNDEEFSADSSTRIKTVNIGPNEEYDFSDTLSGSECNDYQYYAIRAFDDFGNASDVVSQDLEIINKTTTTETKTEETGAIPGGSGALTGGFSLSSNVETTQKESEEVKKEESGDEGQQGEGEVKGEKTQNEVSSKTASALSAIKNYWWLLLLAFFGIVAILIAKRTKQNQA